MADKKKMNVVDQLTVTQSLNLAGTPKIDGVSITASAAELNLLDGVTASTEELNKVDGLTATTAELNLVDNQVATATFVIGTETGGNEITVSIQLKDAAGADMATRSSVGFYLSNDANGDSTKVAATSLVAGTDGVMQEFISNSAGRLVSEADGDIDVVIGDASGAATYYLVLIMPNGSLVVSSAITFA